MTNNDLLKLISISFEISKPDCLKIFSLGGTELSADTLKGFLSEFADPAYVEMKDADLAAFLNGLIIFKRGAKSEHPPKAEDQLSYNMILKKIKIAMGLHNEDIIAILEAVGIELQEFELSAYLRREGHKNYRPIRAQLLRNFIFAIGEVQGL